MSDTHEFQIGELIFHVEQRTFGDDGGPALRVLTEIEGRRRELLRFDCFRKNPHYHYDPSGRDEIHTLDRSDGIDPVSWTVDALKGRLAEMVRHAGYDEVADRIDTEALSSTIGEIEAAMR